MATTKEITIYHEVKNGVGMVEFKAQARQVLTDLHPRFNWFLHEYIGPETTGFKFTISEESTGYCIMHGYDERNLLKESRALLQSKSEELVTKVINTCREKNKTMRATFIENPLWNALQAADFTATELQLADITAALKEAGYHITKIVP